MPNDRWFATKFKLLRWFALMAAVGTVLLVIGFNNKHMFQGGETEVKLGTLLVAPFFILGTLIPIWHWKERYRGTRSNLWGALLVIETTGIVRIVYWIRHVLEDAWGKGRYSNESSEHEEGLNN